MTTTMEDRVHYVASLKLEKVIHRASRSLPISDSPKRAVLAVTQVTVKARDLDDLKNRLRDHLGLIEDDDLEDE